MRRWCVALMLPPVELRVDIEQMQKWRDFEILQEALLQGGVTTDTIDILLGRVDNDTESKDSLGGALSTNVPDKTPTSNDGYRSLSGSSRGYSSASQHSSVMSRSKPNPRIASLHGLPSTKWTPSVNDQLSLEDDDLFADACNTLDQDVDGGSHQPVRRSLYFSNLSTRTTYSDLVSILKGGKILNMTLRKDPNNVRSDGSATVSFLDGAAEFLAWSKRNDLYLHSKRVSRL